MEGEEGGECMKVEERESRRECVYIKGGKWKGDGGGGRR